MLDVGCGFGGTIASLNERFRNLDMVGVPIGVNALGDDALAALRLLRENRLDIPFILGDQRGEGREVQIGGPEQLPDRVPLLVFRMRNNETNFMSSHACLHVL